MAAKRGSKVLIKRGNGAGPEVFTTIGTLKTQDISFSAGQIDTTTLDNVDANGEAYQELMSGLRSISINGAGLAKAIGVVQDLFEDQLAGTIRNFELVIPHIGTVTCGFLIGEFQFSGNHDGTADFTMSAASSGVPTFVAET